MAKAVWQKEGQRTAQDDQEAHAPDFPAGLGASFCPGNKLWVLMWTLHRGQGFVHLTRYLWLPGWGKMDRL